MDMKEMKIEDKYKEYDHIAEEVIETQISENSEQTKEEEGEPAKVHTTLKVDFDKLRKTNVDVVGWIQFDEPKKINYPKEVIEEALKNSKNTKVIQDYVEAKTGVRPATNTIRLWIRDYTPTIVQEQNDYIKGVNEEYLKYYTNLCRELKRCI